ncbi:MAG TPA: hypothetical protein VED46_06935 [Alphaproteobacteria bacterium]|nr:hypothetical protein [Alphaproteobacteria bacterium]
MTRAVAVPTYVIPVRAIEATVHPQTGEAGVQFMDPTSSTVFLPVSLDSLKELASDINWILTRLELAGEASAT